MQLPISQSLKRLPRHVGHHSLDPPVAARGSSRAIGPVLVSVLALGARSRPGLADGSPRCSAFPGRSWDSALGVCMRRRIQDLVHQQEIEDTALCVCVCVSQGILQLYDSMPPESPPGCLRLKTYIPQMQVPTRS